MGKPFILCFIGLFLSTSVVNTTQAENHHVKKQQILKPVKQPVKHKTVVRTKHKPAVRYNRPNPNHGKDFAYKKEMISKTIWCEDRSSTKGLKLVFSVVVNRSKDGTIDGLYETIRQPNQFSCFKVKRPPLKELSELDRRMKQAADKLLDDYLKGDFKPLTEATYFHSVKYKRPEWSKEKREIARYNNHVFYTD